MIVFCDRPPEEIIVEKSPSDVPVSVEHVCIGLLFTQRVTRRLQKNLLPGGPAARAKFIVFAVPLSTRNLRYIIHLAIRSSAVSVVIDFFCISCYNNF